MRVVIGSDAAGMPLELIKETLIEDGHEVVDLPSSPPRTLSIPPPPWPPT